MNEKTQEDLSKEYEDFKKAAAPLQKYLSDNFHPHVTVIVDSTNAKLMEGLKSFRTEEFITD